MTGLRQRVPTALAYGAIVLIALAAPAPTFLFVVLALGGIAFFEIVALLHRRLTGVPLVAWLLVADVYLGIGLGSLVALWGLGVAGPASITSVLLALVPTWAADIAAYAVGSRWGTHKLAPTVSPGKTWEGTLAGFAAAAAAAALVANLAGFSFPVGLIAAVLVGPAGLTGDLIESALKRYAAVKDSGTLLPGHGGVLDRIDSLLLAAPAVLVAMRMG